MTKIPWTEVTINPWVGCSKVAAGCKHCYAEQMARRLRAIGHKAYADLIGPHGKWTGRIGYQPEQLEKIKRLRNPRMIFMWSMSDPFHEDVPFERQAEAFNVMYDNPQHTYQILTKRPDNMSKFFGGESGAGFNQEIPKNWWIGTSISTQADAEKNIPILLQIPAAVRFISIEPMLEKIRLNQIMIPDKAERWDGPWMLVYDVLTGERASSPYIICQDEKIDWVIIGCESGPGARLCSIEDIRDAVSQCREANVPVFVKQVPINGKCSKKPEEWPEGLRIQEYPE